MNDRDLLARHGTVLTPKEREAFELHHIRGMSITTLMWHLDLSRSGVRSRIQSARFKLERAVRTEAA